MHCYKRHRKKLEIIMTKNPFDTKQEVLDTVAYWRQQPNTQIRWEVELSQGELAQENFFTLRVTIYQDGKPQLTNFSVHVQNLSRDFDQAVAKAKAFVQEGDLFITENGEAQTINRGHVFRFGKYVGRTFVDVAKEHPSYFIFIRGWAKNSLLDSKRLQLNKQNLLDDADAFKIADDVMQARQQKSLENKEALAEASKKSTYVGSIDEAIEIEATVSHVKHGEGEYGPWTKTKLIDDEGNIFIYWNDVFGSGTVIDAVSECASQEEKKRVVRLTNSDMAVRNHGQILIAVKGDRVKFRATVKDHFEDKFYFGAKTTKLSRVRKLEIVYLAFVDSYRENSTLNGNLKYHAKESKNFRLINQKTKKEIPYRDLSN